MNASCPSPPSVPEDASAKADVAAGYTLDETQITGSADDVTANAFPSATTISNFEYKAVWSVVVTVENVTYP